MASIINASPSNGIVQTADGSGVLKCQANGVTTNALAWVNFNGSTAAIRASYNVSSVTRSSTGLYLINFATATSDANYTLSATATAYSGTGYIAVLGPSTTQTTSAVQMTVANFSGTNNDVAYVTATIFGN